MRRPDLGSFKPYWSFFIIHARESRVLICMAKKIVLIVDDDDDDRLFMRRAIESQISQIYVLEARSGEQAIKWIKQSRDAEAFDLILLDINMPLMNGFEVLEQIRSIEGNTGNVPTVMISTSDHPEQVREAYRKGANSYIRKPYIFSEYEEIVRAVSTCFLKTSINKA